MEIRKAKKKLHLECAKLEPEVGKNVLLLPQFLNMCKIRIRNSNLLAAIFAILQLKSGPRREYLLWDRF